MTSIEQFHSTREHSSLRKDLHMFHVELRLADVAERQAQMRSVRDGERATQRSSHSLRHQVGQSLVRLGRRVGGDAMTAPAWQG